MKKIVLKVGGFSVLFLWLLLQQKKVKILTRSAKCEGGNLGKIFLTLPDLNLVWILVGLLGTASLSDACPAGNI